MLIDRDKAIAVLTEHWSEMCRGGHPSQTMNLLADFCGAVDQDIRALPAIGMCHDCDYWGGANGSKNICIAPVYEGVGFFEVPYHHSCSAWRAKP